jgi:endonuclease YncB( thermonuclease family)
VNAAEISGPVKIVDGDAVKILGVPIRLEGIDAPEAAQTCKKLDGREYSCGKKSVDYLRHLLGKRRGVKGQNMTNTDGYWQPVFREK